MLVKPIKPSRALYIKLGRSGKWEKECREKGIMRFGYRETPFDAANSGDWKTVHKFWSKKRGDKGTATRDVNQIRNFFEAGTDTLWVTFFDGFLWWCFLKPGVRKHPDQEGSYRETIDGWHNTDIKGRKLTDDKISGNLLKVQAFRGTICDVKAFDYLVRKVNATLLPQVAEAEEAQKQMVDKIIPLMRLLTWRDFELLVDLVFVNSGWRRVKEVGKGQKTVDLELLSPATRERAFVQIKSSTTKKTLTDYVNRLKDSGYHRMFFVWHSGDPGTLNEEDDANKVVLIGPQDLARMVFDAGLTSWLREKVS